MLELAAGQFALLYGEPPLVVCEADLLGSQLDVLVGDAALQRPLLRAALALGVTQLLAVGMTSPLREMTEAAQRMARGDYEVRVTATSQDEVGRLAATFNRMAEDLAAVDRERRALVATVSHELRTPLAALAARTGADELMLAVQSPTPADRVRTLEALAEVPATV